MFLNKKITISNWIKKPALSGNYLRWRITSIIVVGIIIASTFFSAWFIYYNTYTTLSNTAGIVLLETSTHVDPVDFNAFDKAKENISLKQQTQFWTLDLRNIFNYATTSIAETKIYEEEPPK